VTAPYPPPAAPVKNNLVIAIIGLLLFWPVGLFAVIKAAKVNGLASSGDTAGAQASADSAKKLGMIAIIVGGIIIVLYCIFGVIVGGMAANSAT